MCPADLCGLLRLTVNLQPVYLSLSVDLEDVQRMYGGQDGGDITSCLFNVVLHQTDRLTHERRERSHR